MRYYQFLFDSIYTKQQASHLADQLQRLEEETYRVDGNFKKKITSLLPYETTMNVIDLLVKKGIDMKESRQLQQFVQEIKAELNNLPTISIYLAIDPTEEVVKAISRWFTDNLSLKVLLSITVSPTLIGGIQILYKGLIRDYSLRKTLDGQF